MTITRYESNHRMSEAVVHNDTIYLAGVVSENPKGKTVREQTIEILADIDRLLALTGSDKTKILSAQIFLADISTFKEMNEAWDAWVAKGDPPARATVEAKLAAPDYKVEIKVIAAK